MQHGHSPESPDLRRAVPTDGGAPPLALGEARVAFARRGGRTVLAERAARSPTRLLSPRNHGHGAWVYVSTFGGGLVDGDGVRVAVRVGPGAVGLLTTQAQTKVYRSPEHGARQSLAAAVEEGGVLFHVPDPLAAFAGARFVQTSSFRLAAAASAVHVEVVSAGRVAHGERWAFTSFASRTRIEREGRLVFLDATHLDGASGPLPERLARFDAFGFIVALGPGVGPLVAHLRASAAPLARRAPVVLQGGPLGEDGALVRFAAASVEEAVHAVRACLAPVPALLGDDPFARKW